MRLFKKSLGNLSVVLSIGILMFIEGRTLFAGQTGDKPIPPLPPYYQTHDVPDKPITPQGVCGCSLTGWSGEIFAGPSWNTSRKSRDIGGKQSHPTAGTDFGPVAGFSVDYDHRLAGNPYGWQLIAGGEAQFSWTACDTGGQAQVGPTKYSRCYTGPVGSSSYRGDADLYTAVLNAKLGVAYKCLELYIFAGPGVTWVDEDDSGAQGFERVRGPCCRYLTEGRSYSLGSRSDVDFTWDAGAGLKYGITEHLFLDARYTYEDIVGFGTSNSIRAGIGWKF